MDEKLWAKIEEAYRRLQQPLGATEDELKRAFRRLSKAVHPDTGVRDDQGQKDLGSARDFVLKYFTLTQAELKRQQEQSATDSRPRIAATDNSPARRARSGSGRSGTSELPDEDVLSPQGHHTTKYRRSAAPVASSGRSLVIIGSLILQAGWLYGAFFVANVVANALGFRPGHNGNLAAWQSWLSPLEWDWTSGIYSSICAGAVLAAYIFALAGSEGGVVLASIVAAPFIFVAVASAGMGIFGAIQYFGGIDLGAKGITGEGLTGTVVLAIGSGVYVGMSYVSLGLPEGTLA